MITMLAAVSLKVGDKAPGFHATAVDGQPVVLSDMLQAGAVVVVFFPKAFTPGCSQELAAYQRRVAAFRKDLQTDLQVVAVSHDDADTLRRFKSKLQAAYVFVADTDGKLIERFGVRQWPFHLAKRRTFVIDRQGVIIHIDTGRSALDPTAACEATR